MNIAIVAGTRPELIKFSPVIKELEERRIEYTVFHTNQHYDDNLNNELPDGEVIRREHKFEFGEVVDWLTKELIWFDVVLVQGDTNSALAGALAGRFAKIKIGHLEAGIRSYDLRMQEEVNRQMIGRIADYNFCPLKRAVKNLRKEGIFKSRCFLTGNTIAEAVMDNVVSTIDPPKNYIFLTIHRAELVDNKAKLTGMINHLNRISDYYKTQIIYPIHPRTKKRIKEFKINLGSIKTIRLLNFAETLSYEAGAKFIITDSGGIQEETCILGKPCITIRDNTERPETLKINNKLIGTIPTIDIPSIPRVRKKHPYGKDVSKKIIDILEGK